MALTHSKQMATFWRVRWEQMAISNDALRDPGSVSAGYSAQGVERAAYRN